MAKDKGEKPMNASDIRRAVMVRKMNENGPEQAAVYVARRDNIRALINIDGTTVLAHKVGLQAASFLSQVAGRNPSNLISESNARAWEKKLGMEPMALDKPLFGRNSRPTKERVVADLPPQAPAPAPQDISLDHLVMETVRDVADLIDAAHIMLDKKKAARVFSVAKSHALAHDGKVSIGLIGSLLKVLK